MSRIVLISLVTLLAALNSGSNAVAQSIARELSGLMDVGRNRSSLQKRVFSAKAQFAVYERLQFQLAIDEFTTWRQQIETAAPGYFDAIKIRTNQFLWLNGDELEDSRILLEQLGLADISRPRWVVLRRNNIEWYMPEFYFADKVATRISPRNGDSLTSIALKDDQVFQDPKPIDDTKTITLSLQLPGNRSFRSEWTFLEPSIIGVKRTGAESLLDPQVVKEVSQREPAFKEFERWLLSKQGEILIISRRTKFNPFLQKFVIPTDVNTVGGVPNRGPFLTLYISQIQPLIQGDQIVLTRNDELPLLNDVYNRIQPPEPTADAKQPQGCEKRMLQKLGVLRRPAG